MSLVDKILNELLNTIFPPKSTQANIFNLTVFKNHSRSSIQATLYRLRKNGFVDNNEKGWHLTPAGKKYVKRRLDSLKQFQNSFANNAPKNLIVMFDITETKKAEREWFRWHLKKFKYIMVQKSVWVGPSPLPKEFMNYVEKIKLKDTIKTFKLAKSYNFSR